MSLARVMLPTLLIGKMKSKGILINGNFIHIICMTVSISSGSIKYYVSTENKKCLLY